MGLAGFRRSLKPQPDDKKDLREKKKKTLEEAAAEIRAEMLRKARAEADRERDERNRAAEEEVARMTFGPSYAPGAPPAPPDPKDEE